MKQSVFAWIAFLAFGLCGMDLLAATVRALEVQDEPPAGRITRDRSAREADLASPALPDTPHRDRSQRHGSRVRHSTDSQVVIGHDLVVEEDQTVEGDLCVIHGRADVRGILNGDLTVIGSHANLSGTVNGDVTGVASTMQLVRDCTINGDFTTVASAVERQPEVTINGSQTNLNFLPQASLDRIGRWLNGTVLLFRPMAPGDFVSWTVALGTLAFGLALALICPGVITETGRILQQRTVAAFLSGVALVPAAALFCFLLLLTVVGILAVPIVMAALLVFALAGNTAVFHIIGRRLAPKLASHARADLLFVTVGALVCWALYFIPLLGFLAGSFVFVGGLGAFTLWVLDRARARTSPPDALGPVAPLKAEQTEPVPALRKREAAVVPSALAIPRAPFLPRLLANLIDLVVVYSTLHFLNLTRVLVPTWVLYRFAMYAWRSATLGGIVLRLQVIRTDGTVLVGDYSTALLRALSSLLSLLPLGLGFLWILFDPDKNAWHDHISRTFVVQVQLPRPTPLPPPAPA
ncbi:MAG TPA: RDD family protein [Chthoniobacterales bacterium]